MRWEYKQILIEHASGHRLNSLGMEGWELVTSAKNWLIFKRPINPSTPEVEDEGYEYHMSRGMTRLMRKVEDASQTESHHADD